MTEQWVEENSLTSPGDRDPNHKSTLKGGIPPLNDEQVIEGMNELIVKDYVQKFPKVERLYADPPIPQQKYGLFSFVPSKGATPDKDGFYGFAKLRGNYDTQREADEKAEEIIRKVDSYHKIYYTYVGRPFPCTVSSKYSAESTEIDIRKKTTEVISENIKEAKDDEQRQIREIKEKEDELLRDTTEKVADDPYDIYTEKKVKMAQLSWVYLEHKQKLEDVKNSIIKTRGQLIDMDNENSDYGLKFYNKYMDARRKSGLSTDDASFMRYLVQDADLGF